jgi:hypothetical protein
MVQENYNKVYESSGKKFSTELYTALIEQVERVIVDNKASMIIIDGQVGEGKTTLAVECADEIALILSERFNLKQDFDIKSQVCMGGESFKDGLLMCYEQKKNVIIYDESGDFSSRKALTDFNNRLNRVFETFRAFKVVVIMCLPCFKNLDYSLLQKGIPKLLIHTQGRTKNHGNFMAFCTKNMYYVYNNFKSVIIPNYAYTMQAPNFYGHFLDLDTERAKELETHTIGGKIEILKERLSKNKNDLPATEFMSIREVRQRLNLRFAECRNHIKSKDVEIVNEHVKHAPKFIKTSDFEKLTT